MTTDTDVLNWTEAEEASAARQGWHIFDCDGSFNGRWQVCRFDDPPAWTKAFGFTPAALGADDDAVAAMCAAVKRSEPHAIKAWEFIRDSNPAEFEAWGMGDWREREMTYADL